MAGSLVEEQDHLVVKLTSTSLAHDERMISSWRTLIVMRNHLHYDMGMATKSTPRGAHHLSADLYRKPT